ncbi:S1/P1 nuclease [Mucilaginibacter rubeus]|uniref:S1/P1 nuclease n=1 Tax=Mucilaginibacter rubeus TaxID=2027860 RepID=UPI001667F94C|nr:S1/P1 nuclease [Mucilaginibacter rubeus]GGA95938.1 hypothetical protein GCM10011500_09630 [Mucilaginibacter rubeus]
MRKYITIFLLSGLAFTLISWGGKGHRAVATIAQQHLTSNTAYAISAYLKGETMAGVSTWADEHRNPTTGKWHFLNLPLGLNHQQFVDYVNQQSNDNVYAAILKEEAVIQDKTSAFDQKALALKYLIHLVGDAHQPMHISRKEDKGGNTIQVRFDNKGTNLHSLWDSKLIDHEGFSETEIVQKYDRATASQIAKWQADSPMEWLWESYQISSELYRNIKPGQEIDEAYYKKYIQTIQLRINQAGIRLAGELNRLLNDTKGITAPSTSGLQTPVGEKSLSSTATLDSVAPEVQLKDISGFLNKNVAVTGKVYGVKDIGSMVLVNMGAAYPKQLLTLAMKGKAKAVGLTLTGKTITVIGKVISYDGKPEIVVTEPDQVQVGR